MLVGDMCLSIFGIRQSTVHSEIRRWGKIDPGQVHGSRVIELAFFVALRERAADAMLVGLETAAETDGRDAVLYD